MYLHAVYEIYFSKRSRFSTLTLDDGEQICTNTCTKINSYQGQLTLKYILNSLLQQSRPGSEERHLITLGGLIGDTGRLPLSMSALPNVQGLQSEI